MNSKLSGRNFDEEVLRCLEYEIIPTWNHYGIDRLSVNRKTLTAFRQQSLPEAVSAWKISRKLKGSPKRKRIYQGMVTLKTWEEENQSSMRYPSLIYVRNGMAEMRFGNYIVKCPSAHFLLLSPVVWRPAGKAPHYETPYEGKHCELWSFNSMGDRNHLSLSVCYSQSAKHRNSGQYYIVKDAYVAQLFQIFAREAIEQPECYRRTSAATLQTFLTMFLREIKAGRFYNRGRNNSPTPAQRQESPIEMAKQYIEKNLNQPLTIDNVAQTIYISRTSFIREFKRETGMTFREYLIWRRLEEAKYWLTQDACSIKAVSHYIGLKHSRFHQLFQENFGMTPSEFREQQKTN